MPTYVATMRINNIKGVIIQPRTLVQLSREEAAQYGSALQEVQSGSGEATGTDRPIPDDFPHRDLLVAEQEDTPTFTTLADLNSASDEDLESKQGIGPAARKEIRAALKLKKYQ